MRFSRWSKKNAWRRNVPRSVFVNVGEMMCVVDTVAWWVEKSSRVGKPGTSVPRTDTGLMLFPPEYE